MSALTISTATIATDGRSVACVIGGATGALSFTATPNFLGFMFSVIDGVSYCVAISSYTIVGTTVTVNLAGIIPAAASSVQFQGNAGGNLTDTLSNTTPTNFVNPTNNSTVAFSGTPAMTAANSGNQGYFYPVSGSPNYQVLSAPDSSPSTKDFCFNGTDYCLAYQAPGFNVATLQVSIDGGSYVNVPFTVLGTATLAIIASGLTNGLHCVSIKQIAGSPRINTDHMGYISGGTGVISQPLNNVTPVSGSVPASWSTYPAVAFTQYNIMAAGNTPDTTHFTVECGYGTSTAADAWVLQTSSLYGANVIGQSFGFTINGSNPSTHVKLWGSNGAQVFAVRVDGIQVGHVTATNSAGTSSYLDFSSFYTGLSAGNHAIHFQLIGSNKFLGYLMVDGATITTSPPVLRPHMVIFGNSIAAGSFTTSVSNNGNVGFMQCWAWMIADRYNYATSNRGISGSSTHYFNGAGETPNADAGEHRVTDITNCSHAPAFIVNEYIDNDLRQIGANGAGRPHTTTGAAITSTGTQSVLVGSTAAFITGQLCQVDIGAADPSVPGPNYEAVTVTVVDGTHLSANFTKTHASGITISRPLLISEFQLSYFNLTSALLSGTSAQLIIVDMLPTSDFGNAAAYGLTASGDGSNIGAANTNLWNGAIAKVLAPSGGGNGNGSGTFLTAPQIARCSLLHGYSFGLHGSTGSSWTLAGSDFVTNYASGGGLHPNDAGNGLANATNLGNGLYAQGVINFLSPPQNIFRSLTARTSFNRRGSRQMV